MPKDVFIIGGYQTDFARNYSRENKDIAAPVSYTHLTLPTILRV